MADTRKDVLKQQFDDYAGVKKRAAEAPHSSTAKEWREWAKDHPVANAALQVLSYPARLGIFTSHAAGTAAEQALYNSGMINKDNRISETIKSGKGYSEAKKMLRFAVDPTYDPESDK